MQFQLSYSGLQWSDLPFVMTGIWHTVLLTILAAFFGTILGVVIGWLRENSKAVRIGLAPFVDLLRSVPLIIQFILVNSFFALSGVPISPLTVGVIVLSLYMGVLTSELVRSGLQSVRIQLRKAARSLGLSYWQEFWHISAPLALRTVFPGWIGTVIALTKDTALVSVVGYVELLRASQILINRSNEAILVLAGTGLFYFLICYPISRYSQRLEKVMQHD
ncbi:amino acid ABC transporter permease [Pseudomonas aeruginosa]|jgi:His/Glu/Gln/Arg/opine family amino acid ABC transporter permease subunit|uniref:amino acid ABC transporter permease n=1 Tax=Pseudomonas aeruginosa TaxID=287 RepID=UPI00244D6939|nr:amino acid ABC transporter permease [Pseudomonas aeruginosa]MDG9818771.1 amino acid ABC transporter permease [Pseudomonas aeruginosa]MDG9933549.1 amino acid ABC transporter permease [Pseudomonas aeruginosa]MDH0526810.1 amino acid ABC transporter permease [Pseudomonas aeruginosa]MDH0532589.1 amino acid ABC transporter permease [Pseudomonas aeruginosa]HDQ4608387.1 amino acid ABC transporter permease [Pseudomonas aeruginosa]